MALFQTKPKPIAPEVTQANEVAAKIQQRRYQILVHSLIYYELDMNLVPDAKWSEWAAELVSLQTKYPDAANTVIFANAFKDFDGSTGFDLPYRDEQIVNIAYRLLMASSNTEAQEGARKLMSVVPTRAEYKKFYDGCSQQTSERAYKRKEANKVEPTKRKKLF